MIRQRRHLLRYGLGILVALAGYGYVLAHGGIVTALRIPPEVTAEGPPAQGGLQYVGLRREAGRVSPADASLPPPFNKRASYYQLQFALSPKAGSGFTVSARASTGEVFPLFWRLAVFSGVRRLLVDVPAAYPDTCRSLDVRVGSGMGGTGVWRLTRLQRLRQTLPLTPAIRDTERVAGLVIHGHCFFVRRQGVPAQIMGIIGVRGRPDTGLHYELGVGEMVRDWTPFSPAPLPARQPDLFSYSGSIQVSDTNNSGGGLGTFVEADDTPFAHYVTAHAVLVEYDTCDEPLVLHDVDIVRSSLQGDSDLFLRVNKAQTFSTSSGITVTVPAQPGSPSGFPSCVISGVNFLWRASPGFDRLTLPSSPLYRKYHRPIQVSLQVAPPLRSAGSAFLEGQADHSAAFFPPKHGGSHLSSLRLILRQRVNLRRIRLRFVLPVAPGPPPVPKASA